MNLHRGAGATNIFAAPSANEAGVLGGGNPKATKRRRLHGLTNRRKMCPHLITSGSTFGHACYNRKCRFLGIFFTPFLNIKTGEITRKFFCFCKQFRREWEMNTTHEWGHISHCLLWQKIIEFRI